MIFFMFEQSMFPTKRFGTMVTSNRDANRACNKQPFSDREVSSNSVACSCQRQIMFRASQQRDSQRAVESFKNNINHRSFAGK